LWNKHKDYKRPRQMTEGGIERDGPLGGKRARGKEKKNPWEKVVCGGGKNTRGGVQNPNDEDAHSSGCQVGAQKKLGTLRGWGEKTILGKKWWKCLVGKQTEIGLIDTEET